MTANRRRSSKMGWRMSCPACGRVTRTVVLAPCLRKARARTSMIDDPQRAGRLREGKTYNGAPESSTVHAVQCLSGKRRYPWGHCRSPLAFCSMAFTSAEGGALVDQNLVGVGVCNCKHVLQDERRLHICWPQSPSVRNFDAGALSVTERPCDTCQGESKTFGPFMSTVRAAETERMQVNRSLNTACTPAEVRRWGVLKGFLLQ